MARKIEWGSYVLIKIARPQTEISLGQKEGQSYLVFTLDFKKPKERGSL